LEETKIFSARQTAATGGTRMMKEEAGAGVGAVASVRIDVVPQNENIGIMINGFKKRPLETKGD
jgi:hypothetical protein